MVTVVNDWVSFYINYYKKQLSGEQQEQDKALQEFRQELNTLSASFLKLKKHTVAMGLTEP